MALSFPTTVPSDLKTVRGAPRLYTGAYAAAGADTGTSPMVYGGQLDTGGTSLSHVIELLETEGEESDGPSDAIVQRETYSLKATLLETDIARLSLTSAEDAANIVTAAGVSQARALGGIRKSATEKEADFLQIVLRVPNERVASGATLFGYFQFFKTLIIPAGDVTFSKANVRMRPIEIKIYWDWSVARVLGGPGAYGKQWVALA